MSLSPGFRLAVPPGGARRPGRAAREVAAEAAALGGGERTAEGARGLGGAALTLGCALGVLEGENVLAIPLRRPTISVLGGGGGGGRCAPQTTMDPNRPRHVPTTTRAAVRAG